MRVFALCLLVACADPAIAPEVEAEDLADEPADDPAELPTLPSAALVPGCTARATLAGYPAWFFFTRPDRPCTGTPGSGVDMHAIGELIRLIQSVPAGGRIDGHIFSISIDAVGKALLDAQTRGVDVRISLDGNQAASTDTAKTSYLDKLRGVVVCAGANNACVSTATDAISHTKLFTFSTATAPDGAVANDVVWFGSANQTYGSGAKLYNNTVTIYGEAALHDRLRDYLDDLRLRHRHGDYYDPGSTRGHVLAAAADVYISPETQTDLVVHRLDDITPDASCRVRVMQASIRDSRIAVVNHLVALARGGCKVWVVADTVEPDALAALKRANIPVHHMPIHDKSFIVYAKYGTRYEHRVYTGSHNLSISANTKYDEIFVKLAAETGATHPVYDAYFVHFNDAYNTGAAL